jgi:hypothetical protein
MLVLTVMAACAAMAGCSALLKPREDTSNYLPRGEYSYKVDAKKAVYEDAELKFKIEPLRDIRGRILGFDLVIDNKTRSEITLDWKNAYFLMDDKPTGGFIFEGDDYMRRREIVHQPFIVLPKSSNTIDIYPYELVQYFEAISYTSEEFQEFDKAGWNHFQMIPGTYGVYVKVRVGTREKTIKVTITVAE